MKGFGYVGQGGAFSSSSNLSPLAPPFTVDPPPPGPRTNSFGHIAEHQFSETQPYMFGVKPQHENWLQLQPPSQGPNLFSGANTNHATGMLSGTGNPATYDKLSTNFFASQSVSKPYLPQYASTAVHYNSTSIGINERVDTSVKSGGAALSPGSGLWSGSEQWRREDLNIAVPSTNNSSLGQGISAGQDLPVFDEHPRVWRGPSSETFPWRAKSVETFPRITQIGLRGTDLVNSKSSSTSDESTDAILFNMPKPSKMLYAEAPSPDYFGELWSPVNATNSHERHLKHLNPYTSDPLLFYPSTSYTTIHPYDTPANGSSSMTFMKAALSSNVNSIEQPRSAFDNREDSTGYTSSNTTCSQGNIQKPSISIAGYSHISQESSLSEKDAISSHSPITDDYMNHFLKAKDNLKHNLRLTPTLSTAGGDTNESPSEGLDQLNPGVDSPCWRGASGSVHTLFGITESVRKPEMTKSEGCNISSIQENQTCAVSSEAVAVSSPKLNTNLVYHEMASEIDGSSPFQKRSFSVIARPPAEDSVKDVIAGSDYSKVFVCNNSESDSDLEISETAKNIPDGGSSVTSKQLRSGGRVTDSEVNPKDAYVGSSLMSDCSREHVPTLPCSSGSVPTNLAHLLPGASDALFGYQLSGLDVHLLVKAMDTLSELLLSSRTKDVNALKEHDHEVIQKVLNNLNALHEGNGAAGGDVHSQHNFQKAYEGKKNSSFFTWKEDELPHLSSPSYYKDLEQDDHATQAIKKILEENFHDERDSDPHILLYKNLWLETEAALCSMKYKARFTDMKIKMEKYKEYKPKDVAGGDLGGEKLQSAEVSLDIDEANMVVSNPNESMTSPVSTQGTSQPSPKESMTQPVSTRGTSQSSPKEIITLPVSIQGTSQLSPKESVTPNVSTQRTGQSSNHIPEGVDATVMARFHILKSRVEHSVSINKKDQLLDFPAGEIVCNPCKGSAQYALRKPQQPKVVDLGFSKRTNPWPFIKAGLEEKCLGVDNNGVEDCTLNSTGGETDSDECVSVKLQQSNFLKAFESIQDDPVFKSAATTNIPENVFQADGSSSSSDWEHIVKEAAWQT